MNIGYLINFKWYPPQGGGTVHAYQVAQQLMKRGHSIHTIYYDYQAPNLNVYRQRHIFKFIKNIDVLYIRVHGYYNFENFTLLKALKFFTLPVVWEVNAPLEELLIRGKTKEEVEHLNFKRKLLAKFVNASICVSREMREYAFRDLKIPNSYFIPNGSDTELFSPQKRDEKIYKDQKDHFKIVWIGSSNYPWQGVDIIFQVAREIYPMDKKILFFLITEEKNLDRYKPLPDNIVLMDEKRYFDLPPFIASADAGLCLYHNPGVNGKFHFSPLKLFDYMACGLPVIATDIGQISDVIKHQRNGILVNNNIDKIVDNILFLKNNPEKAKQIGCEARKDIENYYNWERVGEETEKILKSLIKGKEK